jgi:hypothetical protein
VRILPPFSVKRPVVETFIRQRFWQEHQAVIRHFLPTLVSVTCPEEGLCGALGYAGATRHRLFLEQYLDEPVESCVAAVFRQPVDRARLVEVGNLAASRRVGAALLMLALTRHLTEVGVEWVVCTVTPRVKNGFRRLGLPFVTVADADGDRLGAAKADWGRYYDAPTVVQACHVPTVYATVQANPATRPVMDFLATHPPVRG